MRLLQLPVQHHLLLIRGLRRLLVVLALLQVQESLVEGKLRSTVFRGRPCCVRGRVSFVAGR